MSESRMAEQPPVEFYLINGQFYLIQDGPPIPVTPAEVRQKLAEAGVDVDQWLASLSHSDALPVERGMPA